MPRKSSQPKVDKRVLLECIERKCPSCGATLWYKYDNYRTVRTLDGVVSLRLKIRRCNKQECSRFHKAYRPEQEGKWALPQHEFGLDVIALVGTLRYQEHRSVPQIHQQLQQRGLCISQRSVSELLGRYDELLAVTLNNSERLKALVKQQGRAILAIDGMQPDVGHEVLWVIRECLSGEILLTRTLLSAKNKDLAALLTEVKTTIEVPIIGVVSDGQQSIRKAVEAALPGVAHSLCHFHYLRQAAKEIYEADRHAKKELKKRVRGVREIEQQLTQSDEPVVEVIEGYCLAVRSALTDDGVPPLDASGVKLHQRLNLIEQSLERVAQKGD